MGDPGRMCTSPITLFPSANAAVSSRDRGAPASPAQRLASEAVALRPGAFVRADEWSALRPEQQHLVRVVAALTSNNGTSCACGGRDDGRRPANREKWRSGRIVPPRTRRPPR